MEINKITLLLFAHTKCAEKKEKTALKKKTTPLSDCTEVKKRRKRRTRSPVHNRITARRNLLFAERIKFVRRKALRISVEISERKKNL